MPTEVQAPIDPNVVMPRAVREGIARSEAAFHAAKGSPPPEQTPEQTPADPSVTPEVTAEVTPEVTPPVTPEVTPPPPEDFAHKYNSMKGRFERSQEQIRGLSEQIKSLQGLLATATPAPATPDAPRPQSLITDQERNDYGTEFLDVVGKRAKEEVGGELFTLQNKITQLEQRLAGVNTQVSMSAREKLEATLTEKIPNWREIDLSDEFKQWLALPDPYSGDIRHNILARVYERNQIPQTLAFFQGFLAEEAAIGPATSALKPDQNAAVNAGKIPLESFAAPGRAKTAAPPPTGPTEKPIITRKEIADFYAASNSGKYRGRDDEKNRIEAEIFAAQREGRIR